MEGELRHNNIGILLMEVPPIVQSNIANWKEGDENPSRPFGFETDNNHETSDQRKYGDKKSQEGKFTSENEAHKKKNEQNSSRQLNVHALVILRQGWNSGKQALLARGVGISEQHKKTSNDREGAEKETGLKNQTVADGLGENNGKQAPDSIFSISFGDRESRAHKHRNYIEEKKNLSGEPRKACRKGQY